MRTLIGKSVTLPAGPLGGVTWLRRFDPRAALVCCRPDRLFDEAVGHVIDVGRRVDDEEVDGADVPAGPDGWADREDRAAEDVTPPLGDEDGCMRQEDELSKQIGRSGLSGDARPQPIAAQGDETIDVRDPGRSDRVVHALVCSLEVRNRRRLPSTRPGAGASLTARGGARNAPVTFPGGERPVLQSVRRALSYVIASAATCALPGAVLSHRRRNAPSALPSRGTEPLRGQDRLDRRAGRRRRVGGGTSRTTAVRSGIVPDYRAIGFEEDIE
jgi:hypothetical protein